MLSKKTEFFLMRKITMKSVMDRIIRRKAKKIGKTQIPNKVKNSGLVKTGNENSHLQNLSDKGFTVLDAKLDKQLLNQIISYSEKIHCYDSYNDANMPVDPMHAPEKTHVAYYRREDLIKCKAILDIANDPAILTIVQDFLGATPTISNINMWWSFGGRKQAEHAQLFHRDLDDWRFCKLFIYLTDVTEKSGPHIYVQNTSQSPKYRKIRRYNDQEIEATFGTKNVLKFMGEKGTAFIVDTYGFHKGLLPESEDRLLLQIQYSLHPIGIENYEPVAIDNKQNYSDYINRLIIR